MRIGFLLSFFLSAVAMAQSQVPFNIQDARTLEKGRTDFILGLGTVSLSDAVTLQFPTLDLTYGALDRLQFRLKTHFNFYFKGAQDAKTGGDNSVFGVKYRFVGDGKDGVSISVAPQYSYPWALTSQLADPNLAPRDTISLIPIELNLRSSHSGSVLFEIGTEKHTQGQGYSARLIGLGFNQIIIPEIFDMTFEYYERLRDDNNDKEQICTLGGKYEFSKVGVLFSIGQNTAIFTGQEQKYFGFLGLRWKFGEKSKSLPAAAEPAPASPAPVAAPTATPTPAAKPSATPAVKPVPKPAPVKRK